MRGICSALEGGCGGGSELEDVGGLIGLFPSGSGGHLGAPGDDGPCPRNS